MSCRTSRSRLPPSLPSFTPARGPCWSMSDTDACVHRSRRSEKAPITPCFRAIVPVHAVRPPRADGRDRRARQGPRRVRDPRTARGRTARALRRRSAGPVLATSPASRSSPTRSSPPAKAASLSPERSRPGTPGCAHVLRDHGMRPERRCWHEEVRLRLPRADPACRRQRSAARRSERMDGVARHARRTVTSALRRPPLADVPGTVAAAGLAGALRAGDLVLLRTGAAAKTPGVDRRPAAGAWHRPAGVPLRAARQCRPIAAFARVFAPSAPAHVAGRHQPADPRAR